ncbi:MAG: DUF4290 domain-containing protein [Bacteroidales bacterium]|nr:DUF4290 domain-containing protein [Bacteroidales bacterium]
MEFNYNTQRKKLVLPEYGRNIQKIIEHIINIKDREERNRAAKTIISIMGNVNPHLRDISDFKHKLWDHLALISDFKLDIDSPYETISKETLLEKPKKIPYRHSKIKYLHYGRLIEKLIHEAAELEEGEEKNKLIILILNHMKKSYLNWNRNQVNDGLIFDNMKELSVGKIEIPDDMKLTETREILARARKKRMARKSK